MAIRDHKNDVIFSYESLQEFVKLIQRQGINNIKVFSVDTLLNSATSSNNHYTNVKQRSNNDTEFTEDELKQHYGEDVIVKYSIPYDSDITNNNINNINSGRHIFVRVGDIVKLQSGSTVGSLKITLNNNTTSAVRVKGFNSDGRIIANMLPNSTSWNLGSTTYPWGEIYSDNANISNINANSISVNMEGGYIAPITIRRDTWGNHNGVPEGVLATMLQVTHKDEEGKQYSNRSIISVIGTGETENGTGYNPGIAIGSRQGSTCIISGEGCRSTIENKKTVRYDGEDQLIYNSEHLYLMADRNIFFIVNNGRTSSSGTANYGWSNADGDNNMPDVYINKDGDFYSTRVHNAVFNDYAEYRTTIDLEPGRCVFDNDDGSLSCTEGRLIPGAQIISDTFGHSMGETETTKTPLAVAGRVLAYPYQPRENYHAGMAVCSGPKGTVDIMTREEIREYPDCIVGIVSEIPNYKTWGTNNIEVNDRIWIRVR